MSMIGLFRLSVLWPLLAGALLLAIALAGVGLLWLIGLVLA
jgi:hypothetical protein